MTTTQPDTTAKLGALLSEVLAHAGQDVDFLCLIPTPGAPTPDGRKAAYYQAGSTIEEDPDDILRCAQLALATRWRHARVTGARPSPTAIGTIRCKRRLSLA